jgi:hypothetical protein
MADRSGGRRDRDIRLSETQMRHPGMRDVVSSKQDDASSSSTAQTSELAQEYHYVLADLRRIGIIAVVMLGALVALAFVLP